MKPFVQLVMIFTLTSVSVSAAAPRGLSSATERAISDMLAFEKAGRPDLAYQEGIRAMSEIRRQIRVDDYVRSTYRKHDVVIDEKVVETSSVGAKLGGFLLGGDFQSSGMQTRLMARDPEAQAERGIRDQRAREAMRKDLLQFVADHTESVTVLKLLAIRLMKLVTQMPVPPSHQELSRLIGLSGPLNFSGLEQITSCITVHQIERKEKIGGAFEILFWEFGASNSRVINPGGLTSKACESTVNAVTVSDEDVVRVNLSVLEQTLEGWASLATAHVMARTGVATFPTFGSPYYQ